MSEDNRFGKFIGAALVGLLLRGSRKQESKKTISAQGSGETASKYDELFSLLKRYKHLAPSHIRHYIGEDAVVPLTLADAAYMGEEGRRVGIANFYHFLNTLVRSEYWELGFINDDPDQKISIATHDLSEDKAKTVAGNYALTRFLGELFGKKFEGSSQALTNFRGTVYKQLESGLYVPSATPNQVIKTLDDLSAKVGRAEDQIEAYKNLINSLKMYINSVPALKWEKQEDKEEAIGLANKFLTLAERLSGEPLPQKVIKEKSLPFFESLKEYASDPRSLIELSDCQIPREKQSVLMHNLEHSHYNGPRGSYLDDFVRYAIKNTTPSENIGLVTFKTKPQENGDNLRIETDNSPHRRDIEYDKSVSICKEGDLYLAHLKDVRPQDYDSATLVLRVQKGELLRRVIADNGKVALDSDTVFEDHNKWLGKQFWTIRGYVGEEVETYLMNILKRDAYSTKQRVAENAITLLGTYAGLTDDSGIGKFAKEAHEELKGRQKSKVPFHVFF